MNIIQDLPYRENVCAIVLNRGDQLFIGERSDEPGHWQFPQGGVDANEDQQSAVVREVHEELGVPSHLLRVEMKLQHQHRYDFRKIPEYARGKWRGQVQCFWVLRFWGQDQDIQLNRYAQEFSKWRWCSLDSIPESVAPLRLSGYLPALDELRDELSRKRSQ